MWILCPLPALLPASYGAMQEVLGDLLLVKQFSETNNVLNSLGSRDYSHELWHHPNILTAMKESMG